MPRELARKLLPTAELRPPARRGDFLQATDEGFETVILIDGAMVYDYSPSPMEIHQAMQKGVRVLGSSSLGALRAVELRHAGMAGSGWVYEQFLEGVVDADDELVVRCDLEDVATTLPLINVRFAAKMLYKQNYLTKPQAAAVVTEMGRLYFEDRTGSALASVCAQLKLPASAAKKLQCPEFNAKRKDAQALLTRHAVELIRRNTQGGRRDELAAS